MTRVDVRGSLALVGWGATVLGLAVHPADAGHAPEGAVLVSRGGEP